MIELPEPLLAGRINGSVEARASGRVSAYVSSEKFLQVLILED